jgi:dienelactone hydrolase
MRIMLLLIGVLLTGPASAETVHFAGPDGVTLTAQLFRPQGTPQPPSIVALHGCGGSFPSRDAQWAETLTRGGHVVLFPDSFGSRGLGSQCTTKQRTVTPSGLRRQDAFAAASWLAVQPGVPVGGIALLGWSNGASTVLAAARVAQDQPAGLLVAFVAFYPGCSTRTTDYRPSARMLILMGESDDWTPIAPCRRLASRDPREITLIGYPGAYHDFDAPNERLRLRHNLAATPDGTAHVGTDPAARADALVRVPEFLEAVH